NPARCTSVALSDKFRTGVRRTSWGLTAIFCFASLVMLLIWLRSHFVTDDFHFIAPFNGLIVLTKGSGIVAVRPAHHDLPTTPSDLDLRLSIFYSIEENSYWRPIGSVGFEFLGIRAGTSVIAGS